MTKRKATRKREPEVIDMTPAVLDATPTVDVETAPKAEPLGIRCAGCGCRHFWLIYVRPVRGARIMRRRACRHCGRRIVTFEAESGRA